MALTSETICDVCQNSESIVMLPCFHKFCSDCSDCFDNVFVEGKNCPTCRVPFNIPKRKLNRSAASCLGKESNDDFDDGVKSCDCCDKKEAETFCVDCSCSYCYTCLKVHKKIPVSSTHKLESMITGRICPRENHPICQDHLKKMKLFCKDCSVLLCNLCLNVKHSRHDLKPMLESIALAKAKLEKRVQIKQKLLETIAFYINYVDSLKAASKEKCINLIDEISTRGNNAKKAIDHHICTLIKRVSEKKDQYHELAYAYKLRLENMESKLNEDVAAMRQQMIELNFDNFLEAYPLDEDDDQTIPEFHEHYQVSLMPLKTESLDLENTIARLKQEPKVRKMEREIIRMNYWMNNMREKGHGSVNSAITFLSLADETIIINWYYQTIYISVIDVRKNVEQYSKGPYLCQGLCSEVYHSLILNDHLYIMGESVLYSNYAILVQFRTPFNDQLIPREISRHVIKGKTYRLSKSIDGNILVTFEDRLSHLSEKGNVLKTIMLKMKVFDAVQIRSDSYAVCSDEGILLIDDRGEIILNYPYYKNKYKIQSPRHLTKDSHDFIYIIGGANSEQILVLNSRLGFVTFHERDQEIIDISYNEARDILIVKTATELVPYEL